MLYEVDTDAASSDAPGYPSDRADVISGSYDNAQQVSIDHLRARRNNGGHGWLTSVGSSGTSVSPCPLAQTATRI